MDKEYEVDPGNISDEADSEQLDLSPFKISWMDLSEAGCQSKLGISCLPGKKYKKEWRSLRFDIQCMKDEGIQDVFCLCTKGELYLYRVRRLLTAYTDAGFTVHHHPIEDGLIPTDKEMIHTLIELKECLMNNRKTLIHCYGGFGRSCMVAACLLYYLNTNLVVDKTRDMVVQLRGGKAQGTVKQYNFISDFPNMLEKFKMDKEKEDRSASR